VLKNLRAARLVTLTGPGGVGKTRLAIEASGRLGAAARFVPLAPVTDPAEVASTVLDALGIREPVIARRAAEPGTGPLDRLAAALGDRDDVLILDNCEHVIEAAAAFADHVLGACSRLRILATSRQPLRIDGETLCPVPPLPIPPAPAAPVTICGGLLAQLEEKQSSWWFGMQAIIQARLALIMLTDGDEARCRTLLAAALKTATSWVELPPVADVIDAIAVLAQHSGECAPTVATLLGAAHAVRGCFDEGSLDAPTVREAARTRLAADEFAAAYERGRSLPRDDALALAASAVANPVTAG
jgi:predicted ATPase